MAAGDLTVHFDTKRAIRGLRIIGGEVTLDGGNPTPVALAPYLSKVLGGVVTHKTSTAPGDDPTYFTSEPDATTISTLNVYAWKNTGGTDPTLVASTNNTAIVSFMAWGTP